MKTRRRLVLSLVASVFVPRALFARAGNAPVLIGWLHPGSPERDNHLLAAFKGGLVALGWKEDSSFVLEQRWTRGQARQLPEFAKELAATRPAVIVVQSVRASAAATKVAPDTPIVQAAGADPVSAGLAASLGRPGGMVTGLSNLSVDITEKHLELLLSAAPSIKRVGFLTDSRNIVARKLREGIKRSVARYKVDARFASASRPAEVEAAIGKLVQQGAEGLVVSTGPVFIAERRRIVELSLAQGWPMIGGPREWADTGALLSYGVDYVASFRRAAYYVDRILKGTKPGDLPVEQLKVELTVNLRTARKIGIDIPRELLVRAEKVIE